MIVLNNAQHARMIAKAAGCTFNPEFDACISRWKDGWLLGGVIYEDYTGESIKMHVAGFSPKWMTRDLLWAFFDYPFNQLGVKRIFGQVPESNTKALEFDLKVGFRIITKIDGVFEDGGLFIVVLERDDCRWLNYQPKGLMRGQDISDGQEKQTA